MHRRAASVAERTARRHRWWRVGRPSAYSSDRRTVRHAAGADRPAGPAASRYLRRATVRPTAGLLHARPEWPSWPRATAADPWLPSGCRPRPLGPGAGQTLPVSGLSAARTPRRRARSLDALPARPHERRQSGRLLHGPPPREAPGARLGASAPSRRHADRHDADRPHGHHRTAAVLSGAAVATSVSGGARRSGSGVAATLSVGPPNLDPWPTRPRTARRSAASRRARGSTDSGTPAAGSSTSARP